MYVPSCGRPLLRISASLSVTYHIITTTKLGEQPSYSLATAPYQDRPGTVPLASLVSYLQTPPPNPPSPGSQPCPVCEIGSDVSLIRKAYAALLSFVLHDVDEEDEEGEVR